MIGDAPNANVPGHGPVETEAGRIDGQPVGYAICGEARSGSTFLAHVLRSTGSLGDPFEFFNTGTADRDASDPTARLASLRSRASTPNGVYGLKVFAHQFDKIAIERWPEHLPSLHFVHLRREDLLGQAISLARALQTRNYKSSDPRTADGRYDRSRIADCLARIAYGQARWECWFARNAIVPLRLTYEQVVEAPQLAAEAVARHIGLAQQPKVNLTAVTLQVQRDATSEQWRARFIEESADNGYLDGGLLLSRSRRASALARWFLGPRR